MPEDMFYRKTTSLQKSSDLRGPLLVLLGARSPKNKTNKVFFVCFVYFVFAASGTRLRYVYLYFYLHDPATALWAAGPSASNDAHAAATLQIQIQIQNTKYTCETGQTRNKLLAQWVHLTNHAAGHSRPVTTHHWTRVELSVVLLKYRCKLAWQMWSRSCCGAAVAWAR
jgi:hypothetical protein